MFDKRKAIHVLVLVALALAVSACGDTTAGEPAAAPTQTPYPTHTPYPAYTPLPAFANRIPEVQNVP